MSESVVIDTSAWQPFIRNREDPVVPLVEVLVASDRARVHPVVAGEVLLGGIDPMALFAGQTWLALPYGDDAVLAWLRKLPRSVTRGVGWSDCAIVYGALYAGCGLLTRDAGQQALFDAGKTFPVR